MRSGKGADARTVAIAIWSTCGFPLDRLTRTYVSSPLAPMPKVT